MSTLIKNGTLVTASEQFEADILVQDGRIALIGRELEHRADAVVDAKGKYVFPGGIDGHVHLGQISSRGTSTTDFTTTPAALAGGTTTVIAFAPQYPGLGLVDSVNKYREEQIEGKSAVDVAAHATIKHPDPKVFGEFPRLALEGVPTVKMLMALKGTPFHSDDATVFRALRAARGLGMLAMVHAENADIIEVLQQDFLDQGLVGPRYHGECHPPVSEEEATARATRLAKAADAPIMIVHVSCRDALSQVYAARAEGVRVAAETCPHYLVLDKSLLDLPSFEGAKYVCAPPLREKTDQDPLWNALRTGGVQVVGSDHCAFNFHGQKEMGRGNFPKIPNGLPGMQDRLHILYTRGVLRGKLPLNRLVDVFATTPARLYGLYPRKGTLAVGADADLVVFDPAWKGTISVRNSLEGVDYALYEGFEQIGRAEKVFLRGNLVMDSGVFTGRPDQGRFVKREPYGLAYNL